MCAQMFTANHCAMLWQHKGEEETVPALKELQSLGNREKGTAITMSVSTGRGKQGLQDHNPRRDFK